MNIQIFKRGKDLDKLRQKLIKKVEYGHGYSILKSSSTIPQDEYFFNIAKNYDNYGYMKEELGEELENLFNDEDYVIGLHRTGETPIDDEILKSIFNKGLINNGHSMSYGADKSNYINLEIQ